MSATEFTTGIDYPAPFDEYAVRLSDSASRYLCILSPTLDHAAFDTQQLSDSLSLLTRNSRQTRIRMLVGDSHRMIVRGHRLLTLARRVPSKIHIQTLAEHPDWNAETIVIRDRNGVLYKPGGVDDRAFYEPDSRASTARHLELFEELWRHSVQDADLRSLHI